MQVHIMKLFQFFFGFFAKIPSLQSFLMDCQKSNNKFSSLKKVYLKVFLMICLYIDRVGFTL